MKKLLALFCLLPSLSFGVMTKYIADYKWDNVENYTISNLMLTETGGMELAPAVKPWFEKEGLLWSAEADGDSLLVTGGDTPTLWETGPKGTRVIYTDTNGIIFSSAHPAGTTIILARFPSAALLSISRSGKVLEVLSLSNEYIWEMLPQNGAFTILAGSPAQIYSWKPGQAPVVIATLTNEDNLLHAVADGDSLLVSSDSGVLYRVGKNGRYRALAAFDNPITDFITRGGTIYLTTATKEAPRPATSAPPQGQLPEDTMAKQPAQRSKTSDKGALYRIGPNGGPQALLEKSGMRFTCLASAGDTLLIGTDKNAAWFSVPLTGQPSSYSSLGQGRFARFIRTGGRTLAVLMDTSRVVEILPQKAAEGSFISATIDTAGLAEWGRPRLETEGTGSATLFTRTSTAKDEVYWEAWQKAGEKIQSSPARFIQYRLDIRGDQRVRSLIIPYVMENSAPALSSFTMNYQNNSLLRFAWTATDDDKDPLQASLYLKPENGTTWMKMNEKPIEDGMLEFGRETLPEGYYRARLVVTDERGNPAGSAKTASRVSERFTIDNTPPAIGALKLETQQGRKILTFQGTDALSFIYDAGFSLNGGRWTRILPADGMLDSRSETFTLPLPEGFSGTVTVKVSDLFGNSSTAGLVISGQ